MISIAPDVRSVDLRREKGIGAAFEDVHEPQFGIQPMDALEALNQFSRADRWFLPARWTSVSSILNADVSVMSSSETPLRLITEGPQDSLSSKRAALAQP
jgi:hypothetical protein